MFSFTHESDEDSSGIEQAKILKISPTFNDSNQLEFVLGRDKRYLQMANCQLSFQLELPENYWLDNDVGAKLFENLEIIICHESITTKSTALDYAISSYIFDKISFDDSYVGATMDTLGVFDPINCDSSDLATGHSKLEREQYGTQFFKEVKHDNIDHLQPWRRYTFLVQLNHGLSRTWDVLPSDIDVVFR